MRAAMLAAAALALAPAPALAQAYQCSVPDSITAPHPENPTPSQPKRVLPIGGYTLAIIWSPQHCFDDGGSKDAEFQCGGHNHFGFTLHGLWPDGEGKVWPQYCRPAPILSQRVLRRHICTTPSPQLLQHEYAKHGTCMGLAPEAYFTQSNRLYGRLRYPDMQALSRRRNLTAGQLAAAIAGANPGMTADMMRITANGEGWLEEVWFCLDKRFRYRACPAHQGGLAASAPVRIWRGQR
ncbi:ribonuclease T2 family protein [Stakelama marina]|uniref:Ribonuclease T n=1 Tax=Stakelama marina TaxID=2826939 RepID=A0A8T4ICD3_9SPHN|nr:ribonuclease T [Stakelama marina]MBR0552123.1 ribonuclease T [Stakelama marina]